MKRKRVDVNLKELDQIIDHAREVPLSESESEKLKEALHALAGMLPAPRSTEKTNARFGTAASTRRKESDQLINRQVTGATALPPTPARREWRFRIPRCIPAIPAQAAKKAKSIPRKNPGRW